MMQGADLLAGPQAGPQAAHHNDAVPHQRRPASAKGEESVMICPSDSMHQIMNLKAECFCNSDEQHRLTCGRRGASGARS